MNEALDTRHRKDKTPEFSISVNLEFKTPVMFDSPLEQYPNEF